MHTDIIHVTLRNHKRSTALERSVIDYWEVKHVSLDPKPRPLRQQWNKAIGPHEGFLVLGKL